MDTKTTLIDGVWSALEQRREVTSPGTGEVVGSVCWGTADDARRAADAASRAFASWAGLPGRARA
ncbi:MAG: aldehyde dehydrogenase family protein, partial [Microbacterium sp.]